MLLRFSPKQRPAQAALYLTHKLIYILNNQHYDVKPEEGGTEYNFAKCEIIYHEGNNYYLEGCSTS